MEQTLQVIRFYEAEPGSNIEQGGELGEGGLLLGVDDRFGAEAEEAAGFRLRDGAGDVDKKALVAVRVRLGGGKGSGGDHSLFELGANAGSIPGFDVDGALAGFTEVHLQHAVQQLVGQGAVAAAARFDGRVAGEFAGVNGFFDAFEAAAAGSGDVSGCGADPVEQGLILFRGDLFFDRHMLAPVGDPF